MHDVETVNQYVAYENRQQTRTGVLRLLDQHAATLREKQRWVLPYRGGPPFVSPHLAVTVTMMETVERSSTVHR